MKVDAKQLQQAAQVIVDVSHRCYDKGWSPATSSNYSIRLNAESAAITCSGLDKGHLQTDGVMAVDLDGQPLTEGKPSAETLLHTQLYQQYADCGAVLHTHSPTACIVSRALKRESMLQLAGYEIAKAFTSISSHESCLRIPIFENTQDIPALAAEVDAYCAEHTEMPAYLIRGHGLYVWAKNMASCWRHLEALEYMLYCELEQLRLPS